ncbi:hypothetical protein N9315_05150 [Alphaproteobacteria bacterium]|nr:hypothetical protein [Alphaproteobacteria bacterium]
MTNQTSNQNTPQTYPCTDISNMERFIDQHKGYIRSTSSGAVYKWTGNRWKAVSRTNRRDVSGRPFCFSGTNHNNKQQLNPLATLLETAI